MNWRRVRGLSALFLLPLLIACGSGGGSSESGGSSSYKETKSMVLDILKSDDGKKAIQEAAKGTVGAAGTGLLSIKSDTPGAAQLQMLSAQDVQQLTVAVKDVLTSEGSDKIIRSLMTDPKFAGDFAKAVQKENKQLHKDLMKDPEYQKQMLQLMTSPDYEKMLLDLMKSTQYRQQMMTVMQEALQSPLYRLELMNLLKKVMDEQSQPPASKAAGEGKQEQQKNEEKNKESSGGDKSGGSS